MIGTTAFIGIRYSRARSDNRFLSFMTWISLLGLTLGVIALIVVISVMNGFGAELERRILGAIPHIIVTDADVSADELRDITGVAGVSRFSRHSALLINGSSSDSELVDLYGIEPSLEKTISIIPEQMVSGNLDKLSTVRLGIVFGQSLAFRLGVTKSDPVTVLIPVMIGDRIRTVVLNAKLTGTFQLDSDLDYRLALMDAMQLQKALDRPVNSYRLKIDDFFAAPTIARQVNKLFGGQVTDWTSEYGDFFRTVKMEKIMMFLLLILIVGIAAFSIVSSLSMLVKEKQADIAVLKTCGMSSRGVTMIFVIQGALIGILGVVFGAVIGIPLAYNIPEVVNQLESLFGVRMLAGTYFDTIPTDVRYSDIAVVLGASLVISLIATIYPAYRAASIRPAEVLRYQ